MSTTTPLGAPARASLLRRAWAWTRKHTLAIYAFFAFAYLFAPLIYIAIFSFNRPLGRRGNTTWGEFTLDNWANPCSGAGTCEALKTSIWIGLISTLVATILGTLIAFALQRYSFKGRATTNTLIFLPMATPEVVLGASLLAMFLNIRMPLGTTTVIIAHIMFNISFVVVAVKARIAAMDPRLEQAAGDLYATPAQTFWKVTFPLVLPGIAGAALLAFSLSFDDLIITTFVAGDTYTFPKFVYASALRGVPPEVYVIGTAMFILSVGIVLIGEMLGRRNSVS